MSAWLLAFDTSAYTTSLAAVSEEGDVIDQQRRLLPVALGERGLRQSEACFEHLRQLPELFALLQHPPEAPSAIAVSTKPRPQPDSYMPVFLVGWQFARVLSQAWRCPLLEYSHQEGHLMAGLRSAGGPEETEFLALHLSGGTTELLRVRRDGSGFREELLGGSKDLQVGQFVDRVGVALGLAFPAGPELERLARGSGREAVERIAIPSYCRGLELSFSGAETQAQRLIRNGEAAADIARAVERCIARSLEKLILHAREETGLRSVLLAGGVMANAYIKEELKRRLDRKLQLYFAAPQLSGDNAVGIAWLAQEARARGQTAQQEQS